jgi:hypothetical protein
MTMSDVGFTKCPGGRLLRGGLLLVLLAPLATGCGAPRGDVSGKVLCQDRPLSAGFVAFYPASGVPVTCRLKEDGSYSVSGVPAGKVKIAVLPPPRPRSVISAAMAKRMAEQTPQMPAEARDQMPADVKAVLADASSQQGNQIPSQYRDPEKSGLEYEVTAGSQTHTIELKAP